MISPIKRLEGNYNKDSRETRAAALSWCGMEVHRFSSVSPRYVTVLMYDGVHGAPCCCGFVEVLSAHGQ